VEKTLELAAHSGELILGQQHLKLSATQQNLALLRLDVRPTAA